jgi:hypothetical protein
VSRAWFNSSCRLKLRTGSRLPAYVARDALGQRMSGSMIRTLAEPTGDARMFPVTQHRILKCNYRALSD